MKFDDCVRAIQNVAGQYGKAPINIAETADLRMVKWYLGDGEVLVTCSRLDEKMVTVMTKH